MYESPIRLLVQQLETHMREQQDKQIFEAIQKCGVVSVERVCLKEVPCPDFERRSNNA